jgi:metal-dependent amidase/aminoacylase/carboxypeptidase family protein
MPHYTLDPVPVACEIVTALQAMVTRKFPVADPVVATVAKVEAGTAHNVIADTATLGATLRTLAHQPRGAARGLRTLATHIAAAHGMTAEVTLTPGFPVTVCDARAVDLAKRWRGNCADRTRSTAWPIRSWVRRTSPTCSKRCRARCSSWALRTREPTGATPAASIHADGCG